MTCDLHAQAHSFSCLLFGCVFLQVENSSRTIFAHGLSEGVSDQVRTYKLEKTTAQGCNVNNGDIPELLRMDLSTYMFDELPADIFDWIEVQHLRVKLVHLRKHVEQMKWLPKLISISLSPLNEWGGDNETLPETLGGLKQLTTFDCSDNRLTSLPETLGELKQLTRLDCSDNSLTSLPETVGELKQLTALDCSYNSLTSLPETLGELKQLTTLNCSYNWLTSLPEALGELKQLTTLGCWINKLTSLPETLGELKQLTKLDCSDNSLTSLPETVGELKQLTALDCSDNSLTSLPETLGELKQLTTLNCSYNWLTSLPEALGELKQLTTLECWINRLTSLPEALGELKQLTRLDCSDNSLTSLPETLGELKELTALDCSYNSLTSLPKTLGELKQLTTLNCSYNWLTSLPEALGELKQLTTLECWINRLKSLPETVGELKQLTALDCSHNWLKSLPETLGELKQLTTLNCSYNWLTSLPKTLGELKQLTTLECWINRLTSLPETLGELKQLTRLDCSDNSLTSLPETVGELKQLTALDCSYNSLTSLPETLGELKQLTTLNCSYNWLTSLPEALGELKQLTTLECWINRLTSLPETLGELKQLTTLDCSDNSLKSLPETLGELKELTTLDCSHNSLTSLPQTQGKLTKLVTLKCSHNQFTSLPTALCDMQLEVVAFSSNSLTYLHPCFVFHPFHLLDIDDNRLHGVSDMSSSTSFLVPEFGKPTLGDSPAEMVKFPKLKIIDVNGEDESIHGIRSHDSSDHKLVNWQIVPVQKVARDLKSFQSSYQEGDARPINLVNLELWMGGMSNSEQTVKQIRTAGPAVVEFLCDDGITTTAGVPLPKSVKHLTICGNHHTALVSENRVCNHDNCSSRLTALDLSALCRLSFPMLTNLVLHSLGLQQVPSKVFGIDQLALLDLSQNALTCLPDDFKTMQILQWLSVADNLLSRFSEALSVVADMPHLRYLNVEGNQLAELPQYFAPCRDDCTKQHGLQELCAGRNCLSRLPDWVGRLEKLTCRDNPFSHIPSIIVEQGDSAVLRYYQMLGKGAAESIPVVKIGLLGETESGKTSLAMCLREGLPSKTKAEDRTKGMECILHKVEDQPFAIIDIGGHSDYYYLHEAVLLGPAVIIITINISGIFYEGNKQMEAADEFYLAALSRSRGNLQIVVVGTHVDRCNQLQLQKNCKVVIEHFQHIAQRYKSQLQLILPRQYDQSYVEIATGCVQLAQLSYESIPDPPEVVMATSAVSFQGYKAMADVLQECACTIHGDGRQALPSVWLALEDWFEFLLVLEDEQRFLMVSIHDILSLFPVGSFGTSNKDGEEGLCLAMTYLASIGKVIFFADTPVLCDAVFLSPQLLVKLFSVIHQHDLQDDIYDQLKAGQLPPSFLESERHALSEHAAIFKQSGVLSKALISMLWKSSRLVESNATVDILCNLIERLDLGQSTDLSHAVDGDSALKSLSVTTGEGMFLPYYAEISEESMPLQASDFLCQFVDSQDRQDIIMQYEFPVYLPKGLWERCLVRVFRQLRRMWVWKESGFGDSDESDSCVTLTRSANKDFKQSWSIILHARGKGEDASWRLMLRCALEVEALLHGWQGLPVMRSVACPHCVDQRLDNDMLLSNPKSLPGWYSSNNWMKDEQTRRPPRLLCPVDRVDVTAIHRIRPTSGMWQDLIIIDIFVCSMNYPKET